MGRIWAFVGIRAFVGKDSGFLGEDSGSRGEGFELCGKIRAFVKRILGIGGTEFGLSWGGIGCRGDAFGLSCGEIGAFVGRILGFRGDLILVFLDFPGGVWALVGRVSSFGCEDFRLSWGGFEFSRGGGFRAFVGRIRLFVKKIWAFVGI